MKNLHKHVSQEETFGFDPEENTERTLIELYGVDPDKYVKMMRPEKDEDKNQVKSLLGVGLRLVF